MSRPGRFLRHRGTVKRRDRFPYLTWGWTGSASSRKTLQLVAKRNISRDIHNYKYMLNSFGSWNSGMDGSTGQDSPAVSLAGTDLPGARVQAVTACSDLPCFGEVVPCMIGVPAGMARTEWRRLYP
jgi:hypothetical protein